MIAARRHLRWGNTDDDERLARYERGLGISACTPRPFDVGAPTRSDRNAGQESPVTSFSRGCRAIADLAALLIIACCLFGPFFMLAWIVILICVS